MDVSVIIPSYQSQATIEACLTSLVQQSFTGSYEVFVVHSSDDQVPQLVRDRFPSVRLIEVGRRALPGHARNLALEIAQGNIVAFLDAHNIAPRSWLADLDAWFHRFPDAAGVGGSRRLAGPQSLPARVQFRIEFMDFLSTRPERRVPFVPAGNSAFRHSWIGDLRFDPTMRGFEDVVFCQRVRSKGGEIWFTPDLNVDYYGRERWSDVWSHLRTLGFASGCGRRRYDLVGRLKYFPGPTKWVTVLYRWSRLNWMTLRDEPREFLKELCLSPFVLLMLYAWTRGVLEGLGGDATPPTEVALSTNQST